MNKKITIIIATKKFSRNLLKTINSINKQSYKPIEIIIISNEKIFQSFKFNKKVKLKKFISNVKNQVVQRNIGIDNLSKKTDLILQLDDRVILKKNCLYELNKFWINAEPSVIGVGINQINTLNNTGLFNKFINRFNSFKGKVLSNGISTDYSNITNDLEVMWLKGGLSSWKSNQIKRIGNRKYPLWNWSVFEDVDFSLSKKKKHKLFVSSKAKAKVIERKTIVDIKNLFYRGMLHTFAQKRVVKKYFKSMISFSITIPFLIFMSLIISILTINIYKVIYNLGRIRGFFIIHFN
jgi:glycosyltransferase involved in cell wall biosynthesis